MISYFRVLRPIRTEKDYNVALGFIEKHFDAKPNSTISQIAEVVAILIDNYETVHYPISSPDPIEAIKFRMEQLGVSRQDLESLIGSKSHVSEILTYKRALSLNQIRTLHSVWKIPVEVLIRKPKRRKASAKIAIRA